jgi:protein involved in sex pheromone biosynthesis
VRRRLALLVPALVLSLSACLDQPEEANDNVPQEQPQPASSPVLRTPEPVSTAPLTVDPPGPTRSPQ